VHYVKFGSTGLEVSRICLGCMSFGDPSRGTHSWSLGWDDASVILRKALDLGITFWDTANVYSAGTSEEIVGRALRELTSREEIVLATKVNGRMHPGPNGAGLSRKAIMREIDASLMRLGTDYVDLYQIHRYDATVPIAETMEAMHDVVKAGKARYIGASSMWAWQFAKAQYTARSRGWTPFVSMQDHVNLLYREEEREMLPLCRDEGVAVIPWSPLARGRLARAWGESSNRAQTDEFGKGLYKEPESDKAIVDAVGAVAEKRGVDRALVALAWVLQKPGITAPIIGATKERHLIDAAAALDLTLIDEEIAALEAPYTPRAVRGF
jgi:1-deoxyxylulose-5-phosphate synthase